MGMQINTNLAALNSYRNLSSTQNDLSKSLEKLSSGLRINRAADDAAGLAISEGLRSQIGGLTVAARNAQDGISVIQTVEGSLTEVHSILQRMRDLAVQAGNDSNSAEARAAIETEADALVSELDRIGKSTNFNGIQLLSGDVDGAGAGTSSTLTFQVGADGDVNSQIAVDLDGADISTVVAALDFGSVGVESATVTGANVTATLTDAEFTGFTFTQDGTSVNVLTAAASTATLVTDLNNDANFALNFSAKMDAAGDLVITSKTTSSTDIAITADTATGGVFTAAVASSASTATAGFNSAAGAQAVIGIIDQQIEDISTARAELGAVQNRFESAINTLNVSKENITAAESRIRDTDMAEEMVNYTRANLLSQAGTAMLAQANQSNSGILQLLR